MDGVKKSFGFGCMRFPMKDGEVDTEQVSEMVDCFLANGFNYFDTAHGYIEGKSEIALKTCLTSRYSRDKYILTDKLSGYLFKTKEEIRPLFEEQLACTGVEYFDYYLMHAQNADKFRQFKSCKAYETAFALKKEGKIKHVGISFHDKPEVLEQILTEYPDIEVVQLQFNYLDFDDPAIQSRNCYEVCRKYNKPVIVMEPVKGGRLAALPESAEQIIKGLDGNASPASFALRFAASFEGIEMVLSGMSSIDQMEENVSIMNNPRPFRSKEYEAADKICQIIHGLDLISCTACRYCTEGCPQKIQIPDLFACANAKKRYNDWNQDYYYNSVLTVDHGKASDCIRCGQCEQACPQHLKIRDLLVKVAEMFETDKS